jgi:death on curing protein
MAHAWAWVWLHPDVIHAVHEEQLAEHGGAPGLRDAGLLESALARPQNLAHRGRPDAPALAARYAHGMVRNHPFVDGNKRTAFVAAELFLALNHLRLMASDADCVITTLGLAASDITEDVFAQWLRSHAEPTP